MKKIIMFSVLLVGSLGHAGFAKKNDGVIPSSENCNPAAHQNSTLFSNEGRLVRTGGAQNSRTVERTRQNQEVRKKRI